MATGRGESDPELFCGHLVEAPAVEELPSGQAGGAAQLADYFAGQLSGASGLPGRQFLDGRGFDKMAAEQFGIGFAPTGGHDLGQHLRSRGFTDAELVKAGLIRENGWDFFQGRVLWPIRDAGRSVLGFGARKIFDDDRMPAKYLNTPETIVDKQSHVH